VKRRHRALSGLKSRGGIAIIAAAAIGVMVAFAIVLLNQQSGDRKDIKDNFRDRATVSAALTQSLFALSSTQGQAQNAERYGTRDVSPQTMAAAASQSQAPYLVLLGPNGDVVSASPGTQPAVVKRLLSTPPEVRQVLDGKAFAISNFVRAGGTSGYELATPIETQYGKRVLVSGISPQLLALFLGSYLRKVPNVEGGAAYLLDSNNVVIATTGPGSPPGAPVNAPGLNDALKNGGQGSFEGGKYFVSAPLEGTPWKVVSTAPESNLFSSVNGAHKWVPWLIFALLAVATAFAFVLLRRVLKNADDLAEANEQLEVANEALEQRAEELGRSNNELEQFASIASHDLKEPLRKVQTLTELLTIKEADNLSDQGRDYLDRTAAAGERMQTLIDDLLKFSRVATQGQPFEPVDLGEVTAQVISDLEAQIERSGASVEVKDLPTVMADPFQMRQLLQNLLSNALKFRREDVAPQIRISGETRERYAEIKVSDNGIGFDPQYNARIFRVFERLHGRGAYPGTGIGLALCRKIVDRHGGAITAESTPGEGSTFTVSLPVRGAEPLGTMGANGDGAHVSSERVHA
jgi:signal transduction histidine kinase